jgi:DNA replication protein DnaC
LEEKDMSHTPQISAQLKRLRLPGMANNLDIRLKQAKDENLGYVDFITLLVQDELLSREANNLDKRLKQAGFSKTCTFEGYDFTFNSEALPTAMIRDLASCHFIENYENLIICGPPGIGKSHIAQAIGHEVCRRGMDVLFRKTHVLINELSDTFYPKRTQRLLKRALNSTLLILDDFAFRKYEQSEAELLYSIADARLGYKSTILTSNRPPEDWYSVFPDPVIGGAILDRLVSPANKIITTKGKSYRKEGYANKLQSKQNNENIEA